MFQSTVEGYTRTWPRAYLNFEAANHVLPDLEQQLADTTGIFKGKERKALSEQITQTEEEIGHRLDTLPTIVHAEGYPAFMATYRKAEAVVSQYNRELAEWERAVQERRWPAKSDPPRSPRSVREQLRRLQAEGRRQQPLKRSVDRDSR